MQHVSQTGAAFISQIECRDGFVRLMLNINYTVVRIKYALEILDYRGSILSSIAFVFFFYNFLELGVLLCYIH